MHRCSFFFISLRSFLAAASRTAVHPYMHSSIELSHQTIRLCSQYVLVNCLVDYEVFLLKSCSNWLCIKVGRGHEDACVGT